MIAVLLEGVKNLRIREISQPEVTEGTVLIRVRSCGICGSDLKFYNFGDRVKSFPAILGHEISGEVVEVGRGVTKFKTGDRIAMGNEVPCRACSPCHGGWENLCDHVQSIGTTLPGGFAEYLLLTRDTVERGPINYLPASMSFDEGALAETFSCVVNAMEFARMRPGARVLVIGAGYIGCAMVSLAKIMGASKITQVDINPTRLDFAKIFGATHQVVATDGEFLDEVMAHVDGHGYDVVLSACSDIKAHESAILAVAKAGVVNLFGGIPTGLSDRVSFPNNFIHYRQALVGGSFSATKSQHQRALDLLSTGKIKTEKLISHRFGLSQAIDAFEVLKSQQGLKIIINP